MANMATLVQPLSRFAAPVEIPPSLWTLPRGGITEIFGESSSGRTALAQWMLANTTLGGEVAAVVDCDDAFDPGSARRGDLGKILWVQCGHRLDVALKAADLILHSGGFGLVLLDLGDVPASTLSQIPLSYWFRFQRAVERTSSALLIVARRPVARSCSIRQIGFEHKRLWWKGRPPFQIIERLELDATPRKPVGAAQPVDALAEV